jgi:hypothetical protein
MPRLGDPRFAEVAKGMPQETGDHLVRWQATKSYTELQERAIRKLRFNGKIQYRFGSP